MEPAFQRADGTGKLSVVRKLAEVMAAVSRVPKSGRNAFHKYDYATEADIVSAVRVEMAQRQLVMVPSVLHEKWGEVPRVKGGADRLCTLTVRFTVHDGESGEQVSFDVIGEGTDAGDKASYKAMTGAVKYALLKLFLIPTGDDPERDDGSPSTGSGAQSEASPRPREERAAAPQSASPRQQPQTQGRNEGGSKAGTHVLAGPYKGKLITSLTDDELHQAIALFDTRLKANPNSEWAPHVRANLQALNRSAELRMRARPSASEGEPPPPTDDDVPF